MIKLKLISIIISISICFNILPHYTNQAYVNNNQEEPYFLKNSYAKKCGYQGTIKNIKKSGGWGWRNWSGYYTPKYSQSYNYPWYIKGYYYPWWYYGYLPYYYWWY